MHLEKFSLNCSSSSFAIRVNLLHPRISLFPFGLFLPPWYLSTLKVYFQLTTIFNDPKNNSKYGDVAPFIIRKPVSHNWIALSTFLSKILVLEYIVLVLKANTMMITFETGPSRSMEKFSN